MRFERPPFRPKKNFGPPNSGPPMNRRRDSSGEVPYDVDRDEEDSSQRREAQYLRQLTDDKTPIMVRLQTGETFRGVIEYYDRRFIRLTRQGTPNLFIYKDQIKYLAEELSDAVLTPATQD